jgi:hypothetical protein
MNEQASLKNKPGTSENGFEIISNGLQLVATNHKEINPMNKKVNVNLLDIKQAAKFLGIGEHRTRMLHRKSIVPSRLVDMGHYKKVVFKQADLEVYKTTKSRSRSGKKTQLIDLTPEETVVANKALKDAGLHEMRPRYINKQGK